MTKPSDRGPPSDAPIRKAGVLDDADLQALLNDELAEAAEQGRYESARAAISAGANVHYQNELPLRRAAARGHADVVRLLLAAGADKSVHDHKPLRDAEANGHAEAGRALREAGSYNPNVAGDFERAMAERAARQPTAGGPETPADIRERVKRLFELRRTPKRDTDPSLG